MSSYGPSLPPGLARAREEDREDDRGDEDKDEEEDQVVGPALPPHLLAKRQREVETEMAGPSRVEEPERTEVESDDDDDEVIGPLPPKPGQAGGSSSASSDVELRSRLMRERLEEATRGKEPRRESWMLELPEERAKDFGLGPRQFSRSRADKGKRDHSWTQTPQERAEGKAVREDKDVDGDEDVLAYLASLKRDQEMERVSKELKEKRGGETLVEIHEKKRRKEKKEQERKGGSKTAERRPFDRDVDLQANRFDDAQKKLMLKRAGQLNDKFAKGATKYL